MILVVFFALFYLMYREVENKAIDEFNNQEFILARQASRGMESFFIYYRRELQFLAGIPDVINMDGEGRNLLDEFYSHHSDQIEAITRVNEQGILVYTSPNNNENSIGRDLTGQAHVRQVMEEQKPVISDVFTAVQGYIAIAYHVPVFRNGEFKGSLAILIPIDKLGKRFLENIRLAETGYAFMLSKNLVELYCPLNGHTGRKIDFKTDFDAEALKTLNSVSMQEGQNYSHFYGYLGTGLHKDKKVRAIFYRVPLGNTYWTIVISTPEKEIIATLKGFRNRFMLLSFLVAAILLVYFYYYIKARAIIKEEKKRREAEEALKESEERWNFALEGSGDGVWDRNNLTGEVFYSPQWKKMLGYEINEISPDYHEWESRVHPEDLERVQKMIGQHLDGIREYYEAEYRMRCRDGSYKWILDRGKVMSRDENGKPLRIVGTHSDISQRKQNEEQLRTLMRAVDQSPASIVITDLDGKIEYVNQKFVRLSGYTFQEVRDKNPGILKSGLVPDEVYEELWSTITKGRTWTGEFQNRKKNGELYWENALISPVHNQEGEIVHYIAVKEDVTEKKQLMKELVLAKEKAEESDRLKSSFLQNMSHEIRTPMNAILGFSEILEKAELSDEERKSYTGIIQDSGRQLLNIVNNILTISFIDTKQERVDIRKVELAKLMQQLRTIFTKEAERKGISLEFLADSRFPDLVIRTDATKLNQILSNLLTNALKFTHNGKVEAGYMVKEDVIEFYVSDTGIGIDPQVQEDIFKRFTQASDAIRVTYGGTGLGLSIARAFVELLGGQMTLRSTPGEGSVFTFTIPFQEDSETKKVVMNTKTENSGLKDAAVILVAEDEDFNFLLIKEFFKDTPVSLIHVTNGLDAVEVCRTNDQVALVLMDIKMPELNGEKATKLIKELRPDLPVIAQSAYAIESEIKKYMTMGFDDYITKPILKEELLTKSLRLLNRKK
ncbi:MAG: PAS domain-containing protein [Bacteroidota bacterium]